jgi:hypothetical protein
MYLFIKFLLILNNFLFFDLSEKWINESHSKDSNALLVGSWKVEIGDQDQYS